MYEIISITTTMKQPFSNNSQYKTTVTLTTQQTGFKKNKRPMVVKEINNSLGEIYRNLL